MLAGRSLPLVLSSAALFATWFGSETVFGASSEFLHGGLYSVIEDPFGAALCLILFGLFYARKLYNLNLLTLGDYFRIRYGRNTELIASILMAPPYAGYIAAQLVAMALILNVVAGIVLWQGIVISTVVVTIYTYIGGMWAISITDFIQGLIIIIGLSVLAVTIGNQAGGFTTVMAAVPPEKLRIMESYDGMGALGVIASLSVLGLGSIPSQDVFQRTMSSGSARTAVISCIIAALLYLTIALVPLFISVCTQLLYPEYAQQETQLALPLMVIKHTSLPIQILFFGSLLSAIMSTTSSAILAPAAIMSENIIKPLSGNRLSDRQLLLVTRLSVILFAGIATVMAIVRKNIYELVGESSIVSLVTLFVPLTLGLYWHKASKTGAILSMLCGITAWLVFRVIPIGIHELIPATLVSFAGMFIGIWIDKRKKNYGENSN